VRFAPVVVHLFGEMRSWLRLEGWLKTEERDVKWRRLRNVWIILRAGLFVGRIHTETVRHRHCYAGIDRSGLWFDLIALELHTTASEIRVNRVLVVGANADTFVQEYS
jgi:hypothetical protein